MKTGVIYTFAFFLAAHTALAGDHIIVVDSSKAMRFHLTMKKGGNGRAPQGGKLGLGLRPVKRQKLPFVQEQIKRYLSQIPNDGSRVYVIYYHVGIAKANEFIFEANGAGKRAALMQARGFDAIVPGLAEAVVGVVLEAAGGILIEDKRRNNQHWSTLHKALEFAEREEYHIPADPKTDAPEILPSVVLITDEDDDQRGRAAWNLKQVRARGGVPRVGFNVDSELGGRGEANPDNLVLLKHSWLFGHANAVWYQYGYADPDSKDWQGKIVRFVNNEGKLSQLPLVNPPVIELDGKQPGKQIIKIKANELIELKANGDARFFQYLWSWKPVDDTRFSKPFPSRTLEKGFRQPGLYTIRVEGVLRVGPKLAAEMIVEVGNVEVAGPVPDPPDPDPEPPPLPPAQKLDITAKFKLQIDGPDKKPRPIKMDDDLWIFDPKGIKASFTNETVVEINGKAGGVPPAGLVYDWTLGGAVPGKYDQFEPPLMEFKAGQYTIGLAASQKDKPENTNKATDLTFEVRQVQVNPSVKDFNGKTLKTKPGQPVEFELNATLAPPGTTYKWDFGDGTPMLEGENPKHVYMMPSKADNPFQPKVTATLPDGQKHTLKIATLVEVVKDMIVAKALPGLAWPGEEVTLKLPDIDPKEIEKVTWTVDGKKIEAKREENFEVKLPFRKPGQTVTFEAKKKNTTVPITGELDVKIREVKPQIVSKTKEVFIGEPIDVTVSNAEGQPAFPKDHQVKIAGDGLNVTNPKKRFFTEPGEEKEITAEVILSGISFKTAAPVKIKVKGITPKIGIKAKK